MLRFALAQLWSSRVATVLASLGLLTATVGFLLLTSTSRTTRAVVTGDLSRAWRAPYDILVRPLGARADLEERQGLLRPNFLSGVTGGITRDQLAAIRDVSGVQIAAPIALAGMVTWPSAVSINDLVPYVDDESSLQLFRLTLELRGEAGLSRYPAPPPDYLLVAPHGRIDLKESTESTEVRLSAASHSLDCYQVPVSPDEKVAVPCFGGDSAGVDNGFFRPSAVPADRPAIWARFNQPIVVAGIDPSAEAALVGLDSCLASGRYLTNSDGPMLAKRPNIPEEVSVIPMLVSNQSFLDEDLTLRVERSSADGLWNGASIAQLDDWREVARVTATADDAYRNFLPTLSSSNTTLIGSSLWTPSDVSYTTVGPDHLAAHSMQPNLALFASPRFSQGVDVPPEAHDDWFRSLTPHPQILAGEPPPIFGLAGQYDPTCLPGFDPLAGYRLETYAPAQVALANGEVLGPTRNMAGYVNSPPLALTTLETAEWLADPKRFEGRPGSAFISAVRIRVNGAEEPGPIAEARLARVSEDIATATGLDVDIVVGSSPRPIQVDLPDGKFGRPALTVSEGWSVKGVAVRFLEAVRIQDVVIFSLVLVAAGLLVAETAYLSVRQRRLQFGLLRALGWSRLRIAVLVELEMLLLGAAVGIVALLIGVGLTQTGVGAAPILAAIPLSVLIAGLGALGPAFAASRGPAVQTLRGNPITATGRFNSIGAFSINELLRNRRVEAGLGLLAVVMASVLLGSVLLVTTAFAGTLDTTLLGTYLSGRVQPFHLLITGLTFVVTIFAIAEIVMISYLERAPELATLRALGWPRRALAMFIVTQAFVLGLIGGLVGGGVVGVLGVGLGASPAALLGSAAAASLTATLLTTAASAGPLAYIYRAQPITTLRAE